VKIESIFDEWEKDSHIDRTELGEEAVKIPKLHHKYYKVFISERLLYRKLEADLKQLKLEKYEFYTQGPTKEQKDKGWELPARGLILKGDIPTYIDADREIVELTLKIGLQLEKIEFLESIIKSLTNRGFQIKSAIDWHKFTMGG
jgi:Recombination, repair and ssDNA binding protein UvsY